MSIVRAQSFLHEMTNNAAVMLKIVRPQRVNDLATSRSTDGGKSTASKKPAQSALQQANTTKIGATRTIDLRKG
jgi:hypothetical protein